MFPLTLELLAERLRQNHLPVPQVKTKSIVLTRIRPQFQQSVNRTLGGKLYFAFNFQTGAMVMSPGKINLEFEVEVTVEDFTRNVFGEKRTLKLTSHPIPITVKPLPTAGRPDTFTGAVGEFSMSTSAQPQEIKTGDPVELTVRLTGKGSLASTPIPGPPPPNNWDGFKIHDATDSVRHTDLRNLHVVKDFKQMVIPLRPEIRAVPPLAFSYFDPEREQYVTLHSEPVLLRVNGPSVEPQGGDPALIEPDLPENPSPVKLKTNRSHPGQLAIVPQPLLTQSWFIALPAMTLFAFLAAFAYRRREMYLDAHPEIRRRIHVRRITAQTLKRLQDPATQKDADEFMSGLQLILRENLGESLGQPAEGLTAEAIQQSDLNLSPQSREALDRIFDQDEMIRFAHADDPLNPHSLLQDLRTVLAELKS